MKRAGKYKAGSALAVVSPSSESSVFISTRTLRREQGEFTPFSLSGHLQLKIMFSGLWWALGANNHPELLVHFIPDHSPLQKNSLSSLSLHKANLMSTCFTENPAPSAITPRGFATWLKEAPNITVRLHSIFFSFRIPSSSRHRIPLLTSAEEPNKVQIMGINPLWLFFVVVFSPHKSWKPQVLSIKRCHSSSSFSFRLSSV